MKKFSDLLYDEFAFHDTILIENSFEHLGFEKPRINPSSNFQNKK